MKTIIQIILAIVIIILAYLLYKSIKSEIDFREITKYRNDAVIQRLKDIRTAEIAYKAQKKSYTSNFDSLLNFIKYDSLLLIKSIGDVPDTLSEEEAVKQKIVIRDTLFIKVSDSLFSKSYLSQRDKRFKFYVDSLPYIPFSNGKKFKLSAGTIEKGKAKVKVFEAFAPYKYIYNGINLEGRDIDPEDGIKVGSMTEPTISGNWE